MDVAHVERLSGERTFGNLSVMHQSIPAVPMSSAIGEPLGMSSLGKKLANAPWQGTKKLCKCPRA